jgi:DNA recombination protein RmuC
VAYGWRQESLAENAEHIRQVGEELYGRLATFAEHLAKTGKSLNSSVQHFNKAVSSFDSRVMPGVRKFSEMGISAKKEIEAVEQIETTPRDLVSQDVDQPASEKET